MEESKPENQEENQPKKSLAHREWVDKIVSNFTTTKENEDKIESLRLELNQQNNFSAKSLFNHLDKDSKNFLTFEDFRKFCQENSIQYNDKNLRQFIHNYDKNNDFCINFDEFKGIVFPLTDDSFRKKEEEELEKEKEKEKEKENNINNKSKDNNDIDTKENNNDENNNESKEKENNNEDEDNKKGEDGKEDSKKEGDENKDGKPNEEEKEKIDPNILSKFGEILGAEMELSEKNIENGKNITGSKGFTSYEAFREIADEDKYITEENLLNFLKKNGAELEDKDMKGIIHRYDNDNDGKLSYIEFRDMFIPPGDAPYKSSLNNYNKYSYNNYDPLRNSSYNNLYNSSSYYPLRNNKYSSPDNNYTSPYNPTSYYPERNNNFKSPKDNYYQSPKIRNTSSALHYDYSTNSDEDHDNCRPKNRYRNSSVLNLRKGNSNISTGSNSRYNLRTCCGCPIFFSCYCCCCCPSYCC